eukprot:7234017-Pyramimonas_sp.AAC.1
MISPCSWRCCSAAERVRVATPREDACAISASSSVGPPGLIRMICPNVMADGSKPAMSIDIAPASETLANTGMLIDAGAGDL